MGFQPETTRRGAVLSSRDMVPITPSDSGTHDFVALYIGTAGDISFVSADGNTRGPVPVGQGYFNQAVQRVRWTGTTASNIFGLVV